MNRRQYEILKERMCNMVGEDRLLPALEEIDRCGCLSFDCWQRLEEAGIPVIPSVCEVFGVQPNVAVRMIESGFIVPDNMPSILQKAERLMRRRYYKDMYTTTRNFYKYKL